MLMKISHQGNLTWWWWWWWRWWWGQRTGEMLTSLSYKRNLPPWLDCTKVRCEQMKIFTICARDTIIHPSRRPPPAAIGINVVSRPTIWSFIYIWVSLLIQISKKYRAAMHYIGQCPCCPGWKHILQFANRKILSPIFVLSPRPQWSSLCLCVHLKYHLAMIGQGAEIQMSQLKSGGSCWSQLDQMPSHSYLIQIQKY